MAGGGKGAAGWSSGHLAVAADVLVRRDAQERYVDMEETQVNEEAGRDGGQDSDRTDDKKEDLIVKMNLEVRRVERRVRLGYGG